MLASSNPASVSSLLPWVSNSSTKGEEKYQTLLFKVQLVVTGVRLRLVVDILVIFAVIPLLIIFIRAAFQKNMEGHVRGHGGGGRVRIGHFPSDY